MKRTSLFLAALAGLFAAASTVSPAQAANLNHTWVASDGSDGNNCDRSTPCATLPGAYAKTAAGGEISCVDGGSYLDTSFSITSSITITCDAPIDSATGAGIISINLPAATDIVVLRGIDFDGLGQFAAIGAGVIDFYGRGALKLENVKLRNLLGGFSGVSFRPSAAASLYVVDSSISNMGNTVATAGIKIRPPSGVTANVSIARTLIENNYFGVIADGGAGGTIRGNITDSVISGNKNSGVTVETTGAPVVMAIKRSTISTNAYGVIGSGGGAVALFSDTTIMNNGTGLFTAGGAALTSYGNNELNANTTTDGAFNFTISRK